MSELKIGILVVVIGIILCCIPYAYMFIKMGPPPNPWEKFLEELKSIREEGGRDE